jgi:hypothetical protein
MMNMILYVSLTMAVMMVFMSNSPATVQAMAMDNPRSQCEDELSEICGVSTPNTHQEVLDARMCLWSNRDWLSDTCLQYVTTVSPSIIEPCMPHILDYCKDVAPGENRIHLCLTKVRAINDKTLTAECKDALDLDSANANELSFSRFPTTARAGEGGDNAVYEMLHSASSFMSSLPVSLTSLFGIDMPAASPAANMAPVVTAELHSLFPATVDSRSDSGDLREQRRQFPAQPQQPQEDMEQQMLLHEMASHLSTRSVASMSECIQDILSRILAELSFLEKWMALADALSGSNTNFSSSSFSLVEDSIADLTDDTGSSGSSSYVFVEDDDSDASSSSGGVEGVTQNDRKVLSAQSVSVLILNDHRYQRRSDEDVDTQRERGRDVVRFSDEVVALSVRDFSTSSSSVGSSSSMDDDQDSGIEDDDSFYYSDESYGEGDNSDSAEEISQATEKYFTATEYIFQSLTNLLQNMQGGESPSPSSPSLRGPLTSSRSTESN